jgi:hypothetical protein
MATLPLAGYCQHVQEKVISLEVNRMPLSQVLDSIARRGHFEFSYNSSIVPGDSLVTLVFRQVTIRAALDELLGAGYVYAEQGKYLIILRAAAAQVMTERTYLMTGYVIDDSTGQGVGNASVYVKEQLQSTLTDQQGYFRLRLRVRSALPVLSVSKAWYTDTDMVIHAGYDQVLSISIVHVSGTPLSPVFVTSSGVERSWWARRFLSYRQRVQSINLAHFFTSSSAQVSLLPWVGTHGRLSGQVTNTYSLNIIGGYSAGVKGIELGGVFNIDKKEVSSLQVAGIVNMAGGNVHGVQLAGIANVAIGNVTGVQVAEYINICKDTMRGVQLSVFGNRAHRLEGVQIGLINIADTSLGYSIGLVSIVKHGGIHQLSLSATEVTGWTAEYKIGNPRLNSVLLVSYNPSSPQKVFGYGYGIGKSINLTRQWGLYGELTDEQLYGEVADENQNKNHVTTIGEIVKIDPVLTFRAAKKVQFFAGPSFSLYIASSNKSADEHRLKVTDPGILSTEWGRQTNAWIGARVGISFF